ncbi:MAG: UDP-2,4-diacetamido-2,4,6-trideoxy-beta-L-altropyranose hydrolase [Planctomycetes bacterium]|nr:UDP-2,4-diacetamido-2,4,6-trideoxy-beta-L-altropyranose hydrolase [Planctomycetota bacterium]
MGSDSKGRLIIRADASEDIGVGHVVRCTALAQAWCRRSHDVCFVYHEMPSALLERLDRNCFTLTQIEAETGSQADANQTCRLAQEWQADWVVLDGYSFDLSYQRVVGEIGPLLVIDDGRFEEPFTADMLLNQNLYATQHRYDRCPQHCRFLLGADFTLLRDEFLERHFASRKIPSVARKILVTFGGSDPARLSEVALQALAGVEIGDLEVVVIVGPANRRLKELQALASRAPHVVRFEINPPEMSDMLAWADLAVSAAGSTSWEMAYMGLPAIVVAAAENQVPIGEVLDDQEMAIYLGWHRDVPSEVLASAIVELVNSRTQRERMSERGRQVFDGCGGDRVVQELTNYKASRRANLISG